MHRVDPPHLLLEVRQADRHIWRCMSMLEKGAHIRICKSKRRREPMAVLVPYGWYVLATGFQVAPEEDGTQLFRYSKAFYDFAMTQRTALNITPEESRNYLLSHDLADPEDLHGGADDAESGHERE